MRSAAKKASSAAWYEKNREEIRTRDAARHARNRKATLALRCAQRRANPEHTREQQRVWRANNRAVYLEKRRNSDRARMANSPGARLARNLRARLSSALKNCAKTGSAVRDLGCSIHALRLHLELRFAPGMSWANYGRWHIDHKRPLAAFDLTEREQLLAACHYSNLQPLWAIDNLKKGASL